MAEYKLVVVFLVFCVFPLTYAQPTKLNVVNLTFRKVVEICRQETNAAEADFEALVRKEAATSMEAKCLRACLMKKFDLMDANGKFNKEVALSIASKHIGHNVGKMHAATEIVDICQNMEVSDNHCEAAEQYSKCANDHVMRRSLDGEPFSED